MIRFSGMIVSGYRSHLMKSRANEEDFADYLKWLRYFHDFCEKFRVNGDGLHRKSLVPDPADNHIPLISMFVSQY